MAEISVSDLEIAFARDIQEDDIRARELYAALCNNRWVRQRNEWNLSWRQAGDLVARIRNKDDRLPAETYLDYYGSGGEGQVAPWVRQRFRSIGYELVRD